MIYVFLKKQTKKPSSCSAKAHTKNSNTFGKNNIEDQLTLGQHCEQSTNLKKSFQLNSGIFKNQSHADFLINTPYGIMYKT